MGMIFQKAWLYYKRAAGQKAPLASVLILGLTFEIAWIIPGMDLPSLIGPILDHLKYVVTSPIFKLLLIRNGDPDRMFVMFFGICIAVSFASSIVYAFLHCKAHNALVKKYLIPDSGKKITDLYKEKSDSLKKYLTWEICLILAKFPAYTAYFIWSNFYAEFPDNPGDVGITAAALAIMLVVELYSFMTRAFVVPVFLSERYREEINQKGFFSLSKKVFSAKLILPTALLAVVFAFSNAIIMTGTIIVVACNLRITAWILQALISIVFMAACTAIAYRLGLFCFCFYSSCQDLIFPDNPLILADFSGDDKIESVHTVFEEEKDES